MGQVWAGIVNLTGAGAIGMGSATKSFIADYRVKTEAALSSALSSVSYNDPEGRYTVSIRPSTEANEILCLLKFAADGIDKAESLADNQMRDFLQMLSYVTSLGFQIIRKTHLTDWTVTEEGRQQYVYNEHRLDGRFDLLDESIMESVAELKRRRHPKYLAKALRWYTSALKVRLLEDQFQYFWFCMEILASGTASKAKVVDVCQRCGGELHCESCKRRSEHRPFPAQRIKNLLEEHVSKAYAKDLLKVRNCLMHGEDRYGVENEIRRTSPQFKFEWAVDLIGRVAWAAIARNFQQAGSSRLPKLLQASTYIQVSMVSKVHFVLKGDVSDKDPSKIVLPKVELVASDGIDSTAK